VVDERRLGPRRVRRAVVRRHDRRHLVGGQPVGELAERVERVVRRRLALERRVEVGDQHVVRLDGLEAAGLERLPVAGEPQRRRRVADVAVGLGRLALRLGRRAGGGARLGAVALVRLLHLGAVERGDDGRDVEPLDPPQRDREVVGVVEHQRRREPAELQSAERGQLAARVLQPRRHDRPAREAGGGDARPRLGRERHPAVAEAQVAPRRAGRRVAAADVLVGLLGQADGDEPPLELVAVAPAQHRVGRRGRVGPRAARIGEVGDVNGHSA
jgi:hypothetical protein